MDRMKLKEFSDILKDCYDFEEQTENILIGIIEKKNDTKILFSFKIYIDLNPILWGNLPLVKEIENVIPNTLDCHKYTKINAFCFGIGLHERKIYHKMIRDFKWFVEKQIKGFLSAFILKDLTGKWGAEEFSHNELLARKQSLQKLLGIYNFTSNGIKLFELNVFHRRGLCYCGSGKKYVQCHLNKLVKLQGKLSLDDISNEIKRIKELTYNKTN